MKKDKTLINFNVNSNQEIISKDLNKPDDVSKNLHISLLKIKKSIQNRKKHKKLFSKEFQKINKYFLKLTNSKHKITKTEKLEVTEGIKKCKFILNNIQVISCSINDRIGVLSQKISDAKAQWQYFKERVNMVKKDESLMQNSVNQLDDKLKNIESQINLQEVNIMQVQNKIDEVDIYNKILEEFNSDLNLLVDFQDKRFREESLYAFHLDDDNFFKNKIFSLIEKHKLKYNVNYLKPNILESAKKAGSKINFYSFKEAVFPCSNYVSNNLSDENISFNLTWDKNKQVEIINIEKNVFSSNGEYFTRTTNINSFIPTKNNSLYEKISQNYTYTNMFSKIKLIELLNKCEPKKSISKLSCSKGRGNNNFQLREEDRFVSSVSNNKIKSNNIAVIFSMNNPFSGLKDILKSDEFQKTTYKEQCQILKKSNKSLKL